MIRDHRTDIQLKKQAFRTSIRREWLQKHFSKIRNSIQESEHFENLALEKVRETVKELPASSISLVELMTEYNSIVTSVVVDEIVIVSEKMVRLQAVEWSHYVYILNRVIEGSFSKKDLEKVIAHTLLSVYECADVLVNRNKDNKYLYESIMRDCLDYFYRSSLFILNLDQMEQNILTAIAIRLWKYQRTPD
jgi:ribosomal protein L16 Arg81 hydroxylase